MNKKQLQKDIQRKKAQTMYQMYVGHCATIIQSHFKAYRQRKMYRQFLPVYRRLRQLLFAGFQGWKTRRIMKLQHVKSQVLSIRTYSDHNQNSKKRIAKRQLIDQLDRLRKRGRWVQILYKEIQVKSLSKIEVNKENCSLYGNIKARSIKNVFKPSSHTKQAKQSQSKAPKQTIFDEESFEASRRDSKMISHRKQLAPYDEIQLKSPKDFYQLLENQLQGSNNPHSKEVANKNKVKNDPVKKVDAAKRKQPQKRVTTVHTAQTQSKLKVNELCAMTPYSSISINKFDPRVPKGKKIQITLSKRKDQSSSSILQNSKVSSSILGHLHQSSSQPPFEQQVPLASSCSSSSALSQLLKTYHSSYQDKLDQLKSKLRSSFPTANAVPGLSGMLNLT